MLIYLHDHNLSFMLEDVYYIIIIIISLSHTHIPYFASMMIMPETDLQSTPSISFADISTYNPPLLLHILTVWRKENSTYIAFFLWLPCSDFELKLILSPSVIIIAIPVKRDHAKPMSWLFRCLHEWTEPKCWLFSGFL